MDESQQQQQSEFDQYIKLIKKHRRLFLLLLSGFFLFCFFVFSMWVKKNFFTTFDFNTTVRLQDHVPLKLDKVFPYFSVLASIQGMSLLLIILLIIRRQILRGLIILFFFFGAHIVELFGKLFINHPPPPFMFYRHLDAASFGFDRMYVQNGNSYPSGHSFRTVFVAIVFIYTIFTIRRFSNSIKLFSLLCAIGVVILVGISRISLGEHWASDVIGGGLFGFATGFFTLLFL
ncbi:MAG TPA: phosphatase PAP2 family protein [Candidatus Saccharimonadales bacterium]|nr:phosphatase PAP2 family protein [Candidatus Saccharimonadales bacterium]